MASKPYLSIEGLRGLLALIVCVGHFGFGTMLEPYGLSFNLHFAVDLFFVISGFVLATSNYYAKPALSGSEFLFKRIARLYPLHLLTLMVMVAIVAWQGSEVSTTDVISNVLLLHNIGLPNTDAQSLNFPSWSISVELWCTLLWFYLLAIFTNTRKLIIFISLLVVTTGLFVPRLLMHGDYQGQLWHVFNTGLLRGMIGTGVGILIYHTLRSPYAKHLFSSPGIGYLTAIGLAGYFFFALPIASALAFYGFAFLLIGTLSYKASFCSLLSTRCLVWLGAISYSVYLLHIPLYHFFQTAFGEQSVKGINGKLILLPSLLVLASLVYVFIEKPSQRWLRKWFDHTHTSAGMIDKEKFTF